MIIREITKYSSHRCPTRFITDTHIINERKMQNS